MAAPPAPEASSPRAALTAERGWGGEAAVRVLESELGIDTTDTHTRAVVRFDWELTLTPDAGAIAAALPTARPAPTPAAAGGRATVRYAVAAGYDVHGDAHLAVRVLDGSLGSHRLAGVRVDGERVTALDSLGRPAGSLPTEAGAQLSAVVADVLSGQLEGSRTPDEDRLGAGWARLTDRATRLGGTLALEHGGRTAVLRSHLAPPTKGGRAAGKGSSIVEEYALDGQRWTPRRMLAVQDARTPAGHVHSRIERRYEAVYSHRDSARDAGRARVAAAAHARQAARTRDPLWVPRLAGALAYAGGAGGGRASYADRRASSCPEDGRLPVEVANVEVVLQHGIASDACTWDRFTPRLANGYAVGGVQRWTTGSLRPLSDQTLTMEQRTAEQLPAGRPVVVIGHSQGGLVARDAGQRGVLPVSAVITLDSPHQGALINLLGPLFEANGRAVWGGLFANWCEGADPLLTFACHEQFDGLVRHFVSGHLGEWIHPDRPGFGALLDTYVGAPYIQALNAGTESFRRASVTNEVWSSFSIWRLGCEWFSKEESTCGARLQEEISFTFWALLGLWGASVARGDPNVLTGAAVHALLAIDVAWSYVTQDDPFGFAGADGFLTKSTQEYPLTVAGVSALFRVRNLFQESNNTHLRNTSGLATWARTQEALVQVGVSPAR